MLKGFIYALPIALAFGGKFSDVTLHKDVEFKQQHSVDYYSFESLHIEPDVQMIFSNPSNIPNAKAIIKVEYESIILGKIEGDGVKIEFNADSGCCIDFMPCCFPDRHLTTLLRSHHRLQNKLAQAANTLFKKLTMHEMFDISDSYIAPKMHYPVDVSVTPESFSRECVQFVQVYHDYIEKCAAVYKKTGYREAYANFSASYAVVELNLFAQSAAAYAVFKRYISGNLEAEQGSLATISETHAGLTQGIFGREGEAHGFTEEGFADARIRTFNGLFSFVDGAATEIQERAAALESMEAAPGGAAFDGATRAITFDGAALPLFELLPVEGLEDDRHDRKNALLVAIKDKITEKYRQTRIDRFYEEVSMHDQPAYQDAYELNLCLFEKNGLPQGPILFFESLETCSVTIYGFFNGVYQFFRLGDPQGSASVHPGGVAPAPAAVAPAAVAPATPVGADLGRTEDGNVQHDGCKVAAAPDASAEAGSACPKEEKVQHGGAALDGGISSTVHTQESSLEIIAAGRNYAFSSPTGSDVSGNKMIHNGVSFHTPSKSTVEFISDGGEFPNGIVTLLPDAKGTATFSLDGSIYTLLHRSASGGTKDLSTSSDTVSLGKTATKSAE